MAGSSEPLADDEVALFWAEPAALAGACGPEALDDAERARLAGMAAAPATHFLAGRALLRAAVRACFGPAARGIRVRAAGGGRPVLEGAACAGTGASLSHTRGLVVCALARGAAVGVDAEWLGRRLEPLRLAERFFAPDEASRLRRAPAEARPALFLRLWTAKEAFLKARGEGIAGGLSRVTVVEEPGGARLVLDAGLADDGAAWQLEWRAPQPDHVVACAVRRGAGPRRALRLRALGPGDPALRPERGKPNPLE
jgi:4'-phosphopantetheinyl transferase